MPRYPDDRDHLDADEFESDRPSRSRRSRPDRPKGTIPWVLGAIICLSVVVCGGLTCFGGAWMLKTFVRQLPQVTSTTDLFLDRLQHGQLEAAYELTSRSYHQQNSRQQFEDFVKHFEMFTAHKTRTVNRTFIRTNQSGTEATVGMTLQTPNNAMTCTLILVQEADEWRVDRITVP